MSIFKDAVKDKAQSMKYEAACHKRILTLCKAHNVEKLAIALHALQPEVRVWVGSFSATIQVPVKSMKHMLEVIEYAEGVVGFEIDRSDDNAAFASRTFSSTNHQHSWFRIEAVVPVEQTDGQTCLRVQKGVETVERPVYELVCTE